jgi:hypothetical protein
MQALQILYASVAGNAFVRTFEARNYCATFHTRQHNCEAFISDLLISDLNKLCGSVVRNGQYKWSLHTTVASTSVELLLAI